MLGLFIAFLVTAAVAWLIAKKAYAAAVLLIAGVVLMFCSVAFDIGKGLELKKSTGNTFFDVFQVVQNIMSSNISGLGLSIMAMGGFAKYMDTLNAGHALYSVVGGPLNHVKSPYVLACMGFVVTQIVGMAIPSAAGLALMLMVTLYPVLIRAGVSRMTAVAIIGSSRFFDLGPGSANCLLVAKIANIEWAEYFLEWQIIVYPFLFVTMIVSHYFVQRYWDAKEGPDPEAEKIRQQFHDAAGQPDAGAPKIYALLPVVPLAILLIFNPIVIGQFGYNIKVDVPGAIVLSVLVAMAFEWVRRRDVIGMLKGMKDFYEGMGRQFAIVVSLIIGGQVFGQGLIAIGAVDTLIESAQNAGLGVGFMVLAMSSVIGIVAFLMGSGNAPFFSFAALVPDIAAKMNVHVISILMPLQNMAGFGRTVSPVTGAIVAVAGIAGVSPFQIVKRNLIPLALTTIVNFVVTFAFFL
ncbi:MAG: C4-dicarboxylate transporter DcuC [Methylobacteriaceae bacterium]|jgi:DcuC family C4-dicarboxylate transporter|nr:C4-dicarboxylate transporter DcuC [Methylobacteriaceae bacterium]